MKVTARTTTDPTAGGLCLITLLRRERARALVRTAFPRRRAHLISARAATEVEEHLLKDLVDAVIIDAGAGDDVQRLLARAEEFSSIPFFLVTPLLPADAPLLARAAEAGVCEILIEGVDDTVARDLVARRAFSTRFERALGAPPPSLHLETALQLAVWQSVVRRAGRPVRTDQLAKELSVSREHLSRSFAVGQAPTLKKVIDLVRVLAAAELSKNAGFDVRDVAQVLGFASSSHLSSTTQRLVGAKASSLSRLRTMDLLQRFERHAATADDPSESLSESPAERTTVDEAPPAPIV
ncbi:AraC family transcriptional regulator [Gemmatimonas aurantiaca T-27]|uniref:AraC family transcriptional regulator n=2 Tax=Gemmatimonas aurantiaca TaxID=173480 RepID=C1A695_GEMAT|nr:helix-turn-helix domain-containing protein [Gemmatimonas aurantiaca]BAH37755.1 AraC family transcriptional regulator [Gemmatimonas aurantiaca T-27]